MNIIADQESRKNSSDLEWVLDLKIYKEAVELCDFTPNIDLFASRLNKNGQNYITYHPDPRAQAVNAFTLSWFGLHFYAFPPFSIILKNPSYDPGGQSHGILLVPHWPTQSWWPYLTSMLIGQPIILPRTSKLLYIPAKPERIHPLSRTMNLLFC